ncbi:MAG: (d)CMP kinase [Candidatus Latescibacteria bacterium]|nr:(d)CMP kinase [Candidatus Latescibacterota bacterium]
MRAFVLAIDGPAGAGKSTTARGVAKGLGLLHVDSGSMYRAAAWLALRKGVGLDEERPLVDLLSRARIEPSPEGMLVNGERVEDVIRTAEAGEAASRVAVHPEVRRRLVALQRSFARAPGVVMEGRDIGTVVFPNADLKIFITASNEARAERRFHELRERGECPDRSGIVEAIRERDRRDTERAASPLARAPDALVLNTTGLIPEEQVELATRWAELARRGAGRATPVYWLGKSFVRVFARIFLDFHVEGLDRIPRKGPLIVACNHISFWDPPLVGATIPRLMHFVAKAELFENRLFGALIRSYNSIPIHRGSRARAGLRGAEDVLSSGGAVLIFPEGTRNKSHTLLAPRAGVARVSAATRSPVLPACITGSNQIRRSVLRQVPIRITFGSPMMPPRSLEVGREEARRYASEVMEAIAALRADQERRYGSDRRR